MGLRLWPIPLEKGSKPTAHGERQTNNECENGTERETRLFSGADNPAFSRLFDVFRGQRIDWRGALGGQELRGGRNALSISTEAVSNALAVHRGARLTPRLIAATIDLMPDRGPGTHENHGNAIPSLMAPDAARRNIVG